MNGATMQLVRLLMSSLFIWAGYGKLIAASGTIAYFGKLGLPLPEVAFVIAITVEIGGGLLVLIGLFARPAAIVLAIWCVATALVAHANFADRNMLIHFMKNLAMAGGFISLALLGPGAMSLDAVLARIWGQRMGLSRLAARTRGNTPGT
jgi:putative oxidoreductase